jgi:acetylornithine deacetylase
MNTVETLEALIGFDTTSANSNLDLVGFVSQQLRPHADAIDLLRSADGTKASLIARIGPQRPGGLVLCGHVDTVPVVDQPWTVQPFELTEQRGRLYGRGTTDMKGFIASCLAAARTLAAAQLAVPVVVALTYDEEVGCLAAAELAQHLAPTAPAAVLVGEPTSMQVVRGHKSVRVVRTTIAGRASHSSQPQDGVSAVTAMAELIGRLDAISTEEATTGPRDDRFTPPWTTINVGIAGGGGALNIVPASAELLWEYRCPPGVDAEEVFRQVTTYVDNELRPRLQASASEADVVVDVMARVPALDPAENAIAATLVAQLGDLQEGPPVAFGTDGSLLQAAGLATVVCGPGSMAQGHQPDEFIEASQLDACDALMQRVAGWADRQDVRIPSSTRSR